MWKIESFDYRYVDTYNTTLCKSSKIILKTKYATPRQMKDRGIGCLNTTTGHIGRFNPKVFEREDIVARNRIVLKLNERNSTPGGRRILIQILHQGIHKASENALILQKRNQFSQSQVRNSFAHLEVTEDVVFGSLRGEGGIDPLQYLHVLRLCHSTSLETESSRE